MKKRRCRRALAALFAQPGGFEVIAVDGGGGDGGRQASGAASGGAGRPPRRPARRPDGLPAPASPAAVCCCSCTPTRCFLPAP
ncbi:MAG: hypothetical protein MZW92_50310 [Comamonadaceae bacterium]|nr:hypothetical protein [Comamonadaceae bacterium]